MRFHLLVPCGSFGLVPVRDDSEAICTPDVRVLLVPGYHFFEKMARFEKLGAVPPIDWIGIVDIDLIYRIYTNNEEEKNCFHLHARVHPQLINKKQCHFGVERYCGHGHQQ